jgi:hypothetical protein
MSLSAEDMVELRDHFAAVLQEFAVPKPSRASERYAALTLSIVLLREQIMPENTPANRKIVVEKELSDLLKKRWELEQQFESRTGGS